MGHKPEKVFIEVTREKQNTGRTKSRKDMLLEKIKESDGKELLARLKNEDETMLSKRDKLYLYYTQLGKCMYSGEPIDINDLLNNKGKFDIDHIFPYSLSGIDSLDNKVIVKSSLNREKSNIYPIENDIRAKMKSFWKMLKDKELISSEKYNRLIRDSALTEADTKGFINRQIVETSQSTKALAKILESYYGNDTKVVYSKGARVSEFRDTFKLPKSRIINDMHHAKDAYLNIVVGNVLNTKYTMSWFNKKPSFNNPFANNTPNAWDIENDKSLKTVKATMAKNTVLLTRQQEMRTGQLFELNPKAAGSENGMIPLKLNEQLRKKIANANDKQAVIKEWTDKYGGYNSLAISHLALVKHTEKKKSVYSFITIPIIRAKELLDSSNLEKYCIEELGLRNVEIIKKQVLFNTTITIDGFKSLLSGSSSGGKQLLLKSATPIFLDDKQTLYVKKLEKFEKNKALNKNYIINSQYDEITREQNEELYKVLIKKAYLPSFQNRPANMKNFIKEKFDKFKDLEIEKQSEMLIKLFTYFGSTNGTTDFSILEGGKAQGTLTMSSKIDPTKKHVILMFQSITGIYEEIIELK